MPGGRLDDWLGFQSIFPSFPSICLYSSLNFNRLFGPASAAPPAVGGAPVFDPQPEPTKTKAMSPIAVRKQQFT
jgi:hypothetical protein